MMIGRSRNDQVATDVRLYMREEARKIHGLLTDLIRTMSAVAEDRIDLLMAGFTHLQPAQPVRFSHWVLSHVAPLQRDSQRLLDQIPRINTMPLGSGALAGHAFGIDRPALAEDLGFVRPTPNSLDAVSDRDFIAEFMNWASLLMVHLSQVRNSIQNSGRGGHTNRLKR